MEKTKHYLNVAIIVMLLAGAYSVWIYSSAYANSQPTSFRSFFGFGRRKNSRCAGRGRVQFQRDDRRRQRFGSAPDGEHGEDEQGNRFRKIERHRGEGYQDAELQHLMRYQNYSCSVYQQYQAERGKPNLVRPRKSWVIPFPKMWM